MRSRVLVALLLAAPLARADRLITVPTARKLLSGTFRVESLRQFGAGGNGIDYIATSFSQLWEAEAQVIRSNGHDPRLTGDFTYNVIAPLPGFSPGFSLGVQDIAGAQSTGTRAFLCGTVRNEFDHGNVPFDVTTGVFFGKKFTPYVGTSIPVYSWLRLQGEHDGSQGRVAFEALPLRGLRLRLVGRSGAVLGSIGYTARF